jgi:hypothetical protein
MNQMAGMSSGRWSKKAKAAWAAVLAACWVSLAGCDAAVSPQAEQWVRSGADALRRGDNRSAIESADRFLAMYPRAEQSAEAYYIRGVARCTCSTAPTWPARPASASTPSPGPSRPGPSRIPPRRRIW